MRQLGASSDSNPNLRRPLQVVAAWAGTQFGAAVSEPNIFAQKEFMTIPGQAQSSGLCQQFPYCKSPTRIVA
jgi:hypothetical protein